MTRQSVTLYHVNPATSMKLWKTRYFFRTWPFLIVLNLSEATESVPYSFHHHKAYMLL